MNPYLSNVITISSLSSGSILCSLQYFLCSLNAKSCKTCALKFSSLISTFCLSSEVFSGFPVNSTFSEKYLLCGTLLAISTAVSTFKFSALLKPLITFDCRKK